MASIEEELRQDAVDDAREIAYFREHLSAETAAKFSDEEMQFILDKITEYYATSGVFETASTKGGFLEIDEEKVADFVVKAAEEECRKPLQKEDVLEIVLLESEYSE
jgi:hypothetical protein